MALRWWPREEAGLATISPCVNMLRQTIFRARRRAQEFALSDNLAAYDESNLKLADRRGASRNTLNPYLLSMKQHDAWIE